MIPPKAALRAGLRNAGRRRHAVCCAALTFLMMWSILRPDPYALQTNRREAIRTSHCRRIARFALPHSHINR